MSSRDDIPRNQDPIDSLANRPLTRRSVLRAGFGGMALAALPSGLLAACGGDDGDGGGGDGGGSGSEELDKIIEAGVVRLGVSETLPTSAYDGPNKISGIFPEMAELVFKELGVEKAEAQVMDFGALIPSLQAGRIDVACGGMYVFKDRCEVVEFSEPIFTYLEAMAVPKGNPNNIRTYEDVAEQELNLGVIAGSAEIPLAQEAGVSPSKMQKYPDIPSLLDAVKAGRVDAGAYDNVTIAYFVALPAYSDLESTEPYAPEGEGSAVSQAFQKGATSLAKAYNDAQAKLVEEGAFDPIFEKWHVPEVNIGVEEGKTLADFCA